MEETENLREEERGLRSGKNEEKGERKRRKEKAKFHKAL